MNDIALISISALISGTLATLITILWQKRSMKYVSKKEIFETLMSTRYHIACEESVKALNRIAVVFHDDENVNAAFKAFMVEVDKPQNQNPQTMDKHLKLLEEMAKALKLNKIDWETIKKYYYPIALSKKIQEEVLLRSVQIQSYNATNKKSNQQLSPEQQMGMEVVLKAMENPGSLEELMKLMEKFSK